MKKEKDVSDIYLKILDYINLPKDKQNVPCMLATFHPVFQTPKIIGLIFSYPEIFNLSKEIKYTASAYLSEKDLITFVLANPNHLSFLSDAQQTKSVLIAFEFSKRRYENLFAGEKIPYLGKSKDYSDDIIENFNWISSERLNGTVWDGEIFSAKELAEYIYTIFSVNTSELKPNVTYEQKYKKVDFGLEENLFILVSGVTDAGKTNVADILEKVIKNSHHFDDDKLIARGDLPPSAKSTDKVFIGSSTDEYASSQSLKLKGAKVINIIVKPISVNEWYTHSKYVKNYNSAFSLNADYENKYKDVADPIIVINPYTKNIYQEIDRAIEEIAKRVELDISQITSTNPSNVIRTNLRQVSCDSPGEPGQMTEVL